jgi:hypothetical protein
MRKSGHAHFTCIKPLLDAPVVVSSVATTERYPVRSNIE